MIGFSRKTVGGHTQNTVNFVTELTPPVGARILVVQAVKRVIRFTLDGSVPTTLFGFRLLADGILTIDIVPGTILKFIGEMPGGIIEFQWGA